MAGGGLTWIEAGNGLFSISTPDEPGVNRHAPVHQGS